MAVAVVGGPVRRGGFLGGVCKRRQAMQGRGRGWGLGLGLPAFLGHAVFEMLLTRANCVCVGARASGMESQVWRRGLKAARA